MFLAPSPTSWDIKSQNDCTYRCCTFKYSKNMFVMDSVTCTSTEMNTMKPSAHQCFYADFSRPPFEPCVGQDRTLHMLGKCSSTELTLPLSHTNLNRLSWFLGFRSLSWKYNICYLVYPDTGGWEEPSVGPPRNAHQHTDSTGSAGHSPAGNHTDNLPGCSGSHVGTCGFRHTHRHLQKQPKYTLHIPLVNAFQTQPLREQINNTQLTEGLNFSSTWFLVSDGAKNGWDKKPPCSYAVYQTTAHQCSV